MYSIRIFLADRVAFYYWLVFVIFQGTVTKMRGRATTNPGRRFESAAVKVSIFKANFTFYFTFFLILLVVSSLCFASVFIVQYEGARTTLPKSML